MSVFANWTFTFIIVKAGPIGLQNIGWKLYIVFILFTAWQLPIGTYIIHKCISIIIIIVSAVWFLYPETKGLTLEEIDTLFVKESAATHELTDKAEHVRHLEEKHHNSADTTTSLDDIEHESVPSKN